MRKNPLPGKPGLPPPRGLLAVAALAAAALLNAGLLGLFHQQAPRQLLLASPALERQLEACRREAGRSRQRDCQLAVVARARRDPGLRVAGQRIAERR